MALRENNKTVDGIESVHSEQQLEDYSQRSQWLRAAILGANDGLLSTASIMMGVGAVKDDPKAMILSGFAAPVGGACSMAIGEYVSVYSQYDIELAQIKRNLDQMRTLESNDNKILAEEMAELPSPLQAAAASAMAFSVGAMVPLLAAGFVRRYDVRVGVVVAAVSMVLVVFGGVGAVLGKAPVWRSCGRVVGGGWLAMALPFGITKLFGMKGAL